MATARLNSITHLGAVLVCLHTLCLSAAAQPGWEESASDGHGTAAELPVQEATPYLFLETSFGAFWPNSPDYSLELTTGPTDQSALDTQTGLYSKRALGFQLDQGPSAYSLAVSYASGETEFAKSRYRIDAIGIEAAFERDLIGQFGLSAGLGLAAARTTLKIDGSAFEAAWSPLLSLGAGGTYELSQWRSVGLGVRTEVLPGTRHDWGLEGVALTGVKLEPRLHTQLEFHIRRRF